MYEFKVRFQENNNFEKIFNWEKAGLDGDVVPAREIDRRVSWTAIREVHLWQPIVWGYRAKVNLGRASLAEAALMGHPIEVIIL